MKKQITAYLHRDTDRWLRKYAHAHGVTRSEIVRILLLRERRLHWLAPALKVAGQPIQPNGIVKRRVRRAGVRPQAVTYVEEEVARWLATYSTRHCHIHVTEVLRLVLEREQEVGWFAWAMNTGDPARAATAPLPHMKTALPKRWDSPP